MSNPRAIFRFSTLSTWHICPAHYLTQILTYKNFKAKLPDLIIYIHILLDYYVVDICVFLIFLVNQAL